MAESVSEVPGNLEMLDPSDEGKKKSKFKVLKNLFGKKKKKDSEDGQGAKMLKTSSSNNTSTSSLEQIQEGEQIHPRAKSSMGNKAISHDSIFLLDPDSERAASKMLSHLEPQRETLLQRSHVYRTLPRTGTSVWGAMSGSDLGPVSRPGIWVKSSRAAEPPPVPPRKAGISPPLFQPDIFSEDFKELPIASDPIDSSPVKASSYKTLTLIKNFSESSSVPDVLQSLDTQNFSDFPTLATSQSCLDTSAARHKMALNPRKQKKNFQVIPVQDEPCFSLVSEDNSMTAVEDADQRNVKKDNEGPTNEKQNSETEVSDKITEQASNTANSENLNYPTSTAHGRRYRRMGSNALGTSENVTQSSQGFDVGDRGKCSPTNKLSRDYSFWNLYLETKVTEQKTTPQVETTAAQELFSDKADLGKKNAEVNFEAKNISAPQCLSADVEKKMVSDLSSFYENIASAGKKPQARVMKSSPATTGENIHSVRKGVQAMVEPSQILSEDKGTSSLALRDAPCKVESSQDVSALFKEDPPASILQTASASASSRPSKAGGVLLTERLSNLSGKSEAKEILSDSANAPRKSSNYVQPSQCLGNPKATEISNLEKALEEKSNSGELGSPSYSPVSSSEDKSKVISKSKLFTVKLSGSAKQPAPQDPSQTSEESDVEKASTGSSSQIEKHNIAADWSSLEGDLAVGPHGQAAMKPKDKEEAARMSQNAPKEWNIFAWKSVSQHQGSPRSANAVAEESISGEPVSARDAFKLWEGRKSEQKDSLDPKSAVMDWGISMELLPPRRTLKCPLRPKVEQVSSGADIQSVREATLTEMLSARQRSQPLLKSASAPDASDAESTAGDGKLSGEEKLSVGPCPSRRPSEPVSDTQAQQDVRSESQALPAETDISVEQSLASPEVNEGAMVKESFELRRKLGPVNVSTPRGTSLPLKHSLQPRGKPALEQVSAGPENVEAEGRVGVQPQSMSTSGQNINEWDILAEAPSLKKSPIPRRAAMKQPISAGSGSASAEWRDSMQPRGRLRLEPQVSPVLQGADKEQTSQQLGKPPGPEGVVPERGVTTEHLPWGPLSQATVRAATATEEHSSAELLPVKEPGQFPVRSKVQEMSSRLNRAKIGKSLLSSYSIVKSQPSKSFVKFMAQQIFSEGPATETGTCVNPPPSSHRSKPLWRPKMDHQIVLGQENADPKGDSASKTREVSQGSESSSEERKASRDVLPSRHFAQHSSASAWQAQSPSVGSVEECGKWSIAETYLHSSKPSPASGDAEPTCSKSLSTSIKGTMCENKSGSESHPNKTKKHSSGSEALLKSTFTPGNKSKIRGNPPLKSPTSSGDTHSNEEILEIGGGDHDSHSKITIYEIKGERYFGVQLRRTSSAQKCDSTKLSSFSQLPSLSPFSMPFSEGRQQQMRRSASQGILDTTESTAAISDLVEKQPSRPKSEVMASNPAAYKIPGKPPGQQADNAVSEPAWITVAKQKQRDFSYSVSMKESKFKIGAAAEPETKEPSHVGAGPEMESQSRNILSSNVHPQKMAQTKQIKSVACEDPTIMHSPAKEKETKGSSALPVKSQQSIEPVEPFEPFEPVESAELVKSTEPVWFAMAKEKAKAWSHKQEIV
ncbi:acrosomal protein KIAA1210 homolog [Ochotona curzoniae]|uniref:acrosomal protein KIAA1210 homolog n=1 Tax=Ochotona curzoniae TaxID=130825 RepID=UPI001B350C84|nr:acrosomal protein KIAA1210 homolog [Ochotona curzoniae]